MYFAVLFSFPSLLALLHATSLQFLSDTIFDIAHTIVGKTCWLTIFIFQAVLFHGVLTLLPVCSSDVTAASQYCFADSSCEGTKTSSQVMARSSCCSGGTGSWGSSVRGECTPCAASECVRVPSMRVPPKRVQSIRGTVNMGTINIGTVSTASHSGCSHIGAPSIWAQSIRLQPIRLESTRVLSIRVSPVRVSGCVARVCTCSRHDCV